MTSLHHGSYNYPGSQSHFLRSPNLSPKLHRFHQHHEHRSASQRLFIYRNTSDHNLSVDLHNRYNRKHQHVHRDRTQQVDAHSHQLLSIQPGGVRPVAVSLWSPSRDLYGLVQVSVHIRWSFLRSSWPGSGNLHERFGADHYSVHRRKIFGYLSSVLVANHVKADESGEADSCNLVNESVVRIATGVASRSCPPLQQSKDGDVYREESSGQLFVRIVHVLLLRGPDDSHYGAVRVDWTETEEVEYDEEKQRQRREWKL